jgi:hypothetical protein
VTLMRRDRTGRRRARLAAQRGLLIEGIYRLYHLRHFVSRKRHFQLRPNSVDNVARRKTFRSNDLGRNNLSIRRIGLTKNTSRGNTRHRDLVLCLQALNT